MWTSLKTDALILKSEPFREADLRYFALTPRQGKITFIARGARKAKAKLAAHLEPMTVVTLELIHGKTGLTVINAERRQVFPAIARDIDRRLLSHAICGFIDAFLFDGHDDTEVYQESLALLHVLETGDRMSEAHQAFLCGGYLLRLSRVLGYDVELFDCLMCHERLKEDGFEWHVQQGGLLCSWCLVKQPDSGRPVRNQTVKLLRFAREAGFHDFHKTALDGDVLSEYCQCIHDVITYHIPTYKRAPFWELITV